MQWIFLLGVSTGMRAMTPMAVLCWFAYLGWTPLHGWAFWTANLVSAIVFSAMAFGEYIGDTLPRTPNRTSAFPATARLIFSGLAGALACSTLEEPAAGGVILGVLGAVAGTWGGFHARARCAHWFGRDLPAALLESAVALLLAVWAMHHIAHDVALSASWWQHRIAAAQQ